MFTKKQQPKPKLSLRKVVDDARKQAVREKLTSNSSDASLPPAVPDADGKPKAMDNGEEPADVSELATHAQWHSLTRTTAYMRMLLAASERIFLFCSIAGVHVQSYSHR